MRCLRSSLDKDKKKNPNTMVPPALGAGESAILIFCSLFAYFNFKKGKNQDHRAF